MNKLTAQEIIQQAKDYRDRWGSVGFGTRLDVNVVINAAIELLDQVEGQGDTVSKDELTQTRRELTAAKAREGKLKKQIEQLKSDLRDTQLTVEG
jgi:cell division protein FtsB